MNKSIWIVLVMLLTFISGCAEAPKTGNSADEQRARADKAHGELSSDVRK